MAMAAAAVRGRIAPMVLRLANADASPASVAAMLMPANGVAGIGSPQGPGGRLCFSIGPVPRATREGNAADMTDRQGFLRMAEDVLRSGQTGGLGLVAVPKRSGATDVEYAALQETIRRTLEESSPGAAAGALGDGRYGVLSQTTLDIDDVVARLQRQLEGHAAAGRIAGSQMALDGSGLPPAQAVRALRYALGRFAEGQSSAIGAAGGAAGLAGIIATSETRARSLRGTITDRRFKLLYQPVVGLADRAIHHFEALIRPIPVQGEPAQSIQEFVTFAEMLGLSEELDWAVLETALEALRAAPQASIAVNMSGLSMQSPAYRSRLMQRLVEARGLIGPIGSDRLLIELTETAEIDDLSGAAAAIGALREAGVPVCLDDFGAGASAFRYLRAFPVDYVKIDGAYVRAAQNSARERGMVASMVEISTSVGAKVVAEMIETEDEARLMQELGVQYGQGWLFGRPGHLPGRR